VWAQGILNAAGNLLGNGNRVTSQGPFPNTTLSLAFNFFGDNNSVTAGWGPFAIAGAIEQNLKTITRSLPGININGITAAGATSIASSKKSTTLTASATSGGTTSPSAAGGVGNKNAAASSSSSASSKKSSAGVGGSKRDKSS
jgi:hypothetical protein